MLRASDFIETIGVNTRIPYADGDYRSGANILSSLGWLGIDHVRDFGVWNKWVGQSNYALLADAGIKFDMVIQTNRSPDDFITQVATFDQGHPGSVFAIEGPNEIDLFPPTYNGLTGIAAGEAIVNRLARLASASPYLNGSLVYDLTGATATDRADYDNVHLYSRNGSEPFSMISKAVTTHAQLEPGRPLVITETGYLTGTGTSSWVGVDQPTQAKLTLNLLLDAEKLGVSQTYLFQLFDAYPDATGTRIDANMGLFEYGYDPKLSAIALHNFTTILADHGTNRASFTPQELNYSVRNLPVSGNQLVMEKSNGAHDIVLWAEPDIWDQASGRPITVAATQSTVAFGGAHYDVRLFDPLVSDQPISIYANAASVTVPVSDHPVIVEVTPVGSPKEDLAAEANNLVITLSGTGNADTIDGSIWDNVILGLGGNDVIKGGGGNDHLYGGEGNDIVVGGTGDDFISGGNGRDVATGGGGADIFGFDVNDARGKTLGTLDLVADWNLADKIDLSVKGSSANYFEGAASDFASAVQMAAAHLVGGVKICSIAVGTDLFLFAELSTAHLGFDFTVELQNTQLSEIGWSNFI